MQRSKVDPAPALVARTASGTLLSSVCHDLKEPLASILMGAGFLRKAMPSGDPAMQRVVDVIQRAADKMGQRITFFADLARLEANELRLSIAASAVGTALEAAALQLATIANERNVSVSSEPGPLALTTVEADRERLTQILQLLGLCTLRVVPERGTVVLRAQQGPSATITFVVRADGPVADGSRKMVAELPKPELAVASGLVALHGGLLAIERDDNSLSMSFSLPSDRRSTAEEERHHSQNEKQEE